MIDFIKQHFVGIIAVVALVALFHLRRKWVPLLEDRLGPRYIQLRDHLRGPEVGSFDLDAEQGLTSATFDIESDNIARGDTRKGLDAAGKRAVQQLMKDKGLSFDEARLEYTRSLMQENNIAPDGTPLDPRAVTSLI